MAIPSDNKFGTNTKTEIVALRAAVASPFLTVGSRAHFKDQLVGKRNGQSYQFVLRDVGSFNKDLDLTGKTTKRKLAERTITLELADYNVVVDTNTIEAVTDVDWDKQVADPNGRQLGEGVSRIAVNDAFMCATTAFAGTGFSPLAEASAHLGDVTSEKLYGFIDSKFQAILSSNGQAFNPVGAPDLYKTGLLGEFHQCEYRSQRFMPIVSVPSVGTLAAITLTKNTAGDGLVLKFDGDSNDPLIKKGTPVYIDGIVACDTIGGATSTPFAFIACKDVTYDSHVGTLEVKGVPGVLVEDQSTHTLTVTGGTRVMCWDDGSDVVLDATAGTPSSATGSVNDKGVTTLAAGKYVCGQLRAEGSYEFETLPKMDAANAETKIGTVEGFTVIENRVVDLTTMVSTTRWDVVPLMGVVEPRATANVYSKIS